MLDLKFSSGLGLGLGLGRAGLGLGLGLVVCGLDYNTALNERKAHEWRCKNGNVFSRPMPMGNTYIRSSVSRSQNHAISLSLSKYM